MSEVVDSYGSKVSEADFLKAPEDYSYIENQCLYDSIFRAHNGPGTEDEWLWAKMTDQAVCDNLTYDKLQQMIDGTSDFLDRLIALRDKINEMPLLRN